MKQTASGYQSGRQPAQKDIGWAAVLGFILAIAGLSLLAMVLMVVVLGTSWLPVYGAGDEAPPTLISELIPAQALAPAPTSAPVVLPTPLPDELFTSATGAPQSGFGGAALLPESPADSGRSTEGALAANDPAAAADLSTRLEIPAIGVNAPIQPVGLIELEEDGRRYLQWQVPNDYAIGWHTNSAPLGSSGNTVLNGHNNVYGAVFRNLVELELGNEILVYTGGQINRYQVAHREVLEEKGQPLDVRLDNAKWMFPTADERLTLISCWPDIGATHRVIVVATAIDSE
jgi:sortase A